MKNTLLKNTIVISIGNIATKLLMFVLIPFYLIWLTPEEYGTYDVYLSFAIFVIPILTLQLEQSVFRYMIEKQRFRKVAFSNAIILVTISMFLFDVVMWITLPMSAFLICFLLYVNLNGYMIILLEYVRGSGKLKMYSLINIVISCLILVNNFIFTGFLGWGIEGLFISYILAYFLACIFIIVCFKPKLQWQNNICILKQQLAYSLPMIPNSISFWIVNLSDRFIISIFLGASFNGLYAVACKLPSLINTLYTPFNLAWQQEAIQSIQNSDYSIFKKMFKQVIGSLFSILFLLIVFLKSIYAIFINDIYYESIYSAFYLLLGAILLCIAQYLGGIMLAIKKTKPIGVSTTICAVVNIILNLVFLKQVGLVFASFSTMLSYFLLCGMRMYVLRKMIDKKIVLRMICYIILSFACSLAILNINIYMEKILMLLSIILFYYMNYKLLLKLWKR